jgi:coenzyme PQQ precursor peptide PqqA
LHRVPNEALNRGIHADQSGGNDMAWKTPKIVEIALGAEINCYACAEL